MIAIKLIKHYPIIMNLYISIILVSQLLGIDIYMDDYIYPFIGQSFMVNIIMFLLSKKFKFCIWHRILICNMSLCLALEALYNFGIDIENSYYIIFISTTISIFASFVIYKLKGTYESKDEEKPD